MSLRIFSALIVLFLLVPNASAQKGGSAEVIVRGGEIVTVNELRPRAEAVAVSGGRIVAVGYSDEVMKLKGPNTKVIDLGGKTLVPGFRFHRRPRAHLQRGRTGARGEPACGARRRCEGHRLAAGQVTRMAPR